MPTPHIEIKFFSPTHKQPNQFHPALESSQAMLVVVVVVVVVVLLLLLLLLMLLLLLLSAAVRHRVPDFKICSVFHCI